MDPGTIGSDDEIEYFDESEDENQEVLHKAKDRQASS